MKIACILLLSILASGALAQHPSRKSKLPVAKIEYGTASYYGGKFHGKKTANGKKFDMNALTAAHNRLSLGTYVKVTNLRNRRTVIVRITDRMHHRNKRLIDLSRAAASKLGFIRAGLARVKVEALGKTPPKPDVASTP